MTMPITTRRKVSANAIARAMRTMNPTARCFSAILLACVRLEKQEVVSVHIHTIDVRIENLLAAVGIGLYLLDCLKNMLGFSTKMDERLPGVFADVVERRNGVRVVPLNKTPDAVPKLVMLICPISKRSWSRSMRSALPWFSDRLST